MLREVASDEPLERSIMGRRQSVMWRNSSGSLMEVEISSWESACMKASVIMASMLSAARWLYTVPV